MTNEQILIGLVEWASNRIDEINNLICVDAPSDWEEFYETRAKAFFGKMSAKEGILLQAISGSSCLEMLDGCWSKSPNLELDILSGKVEMSYFEWIDYRQYDFWFMVGGAETFVQVEGPVSYDNCRKEHKHLVSEQLKFLARYKSEKLDQAMQLIEKFLNKQSQSHDTWSVARQDDDKVYVWVRDHQVRYYNMPEDEEECIISHDDEMMTIYKTEWSKCVYVKDHAKLAHILETNDEWFGHFCEQIGFVWWPLN